MRKVLLKNLFAALIILTAIGTANAEVIITEVLYDPLNTDSGGEFVEIHNSGNTTINIGSWTIRTETSLADATIPPNTFINPDSHYLIADANWSVSKDQPDWPAADREEAMTLANVDAGVALVSSNGTILDAVGWGNPVNIGAGLYEGTPAAAVSQGKSLHRIKINGSYADTQNNVNDFQEATPSPTAKKNESSSTVIEVKAIVTGSAPSVINITVIDEDLTLDGSQAAPVPGTDKNVGITAIVTDGNGHNDIASVYAAANNGIYILNKTSVIDNKTAAYTGALAMRFYDTPGNYSFTINALDASNLTGNRSAAFEYQSLIAIAVDAASLTFLATPGAYSEVAGDTSFGTTDNATLRNTGNVNVDAEIAGTNLSIGGSFIGVENMVYAFGAADYAGNLGGALSYIQIAKNINLMPGPVSTLPLNFRLNVPAGTTPGNYTGSISLFAVKG